MAAVRKRWKFEEEKEETTVNTEGWQVVYTAFALLMLSFFIMLCSYSTLASAKVIRFSKSFVDAVSIFSGGFKLEEGPLVLESSMEMVIADRIISRLKASFEKAAEDAGFLGELQLKTVGNDIYMRLPDNILFKLGEAAIERSAYRLLSKISAVFKEGSYDIRIEGHTDNLPISTPAFPSNWELSTARAVNVLRFFHERERIDSNRLSAVGLSEYRPVADNNTREGRRQNRRVEIILENVVKDTEESDIISETKKHESADFIKDDSLLLELQENVGG